jgi:serine/threonine protein kinase
LQNEPIRAHPNIVKLLGICWEFEAESGSIAPVLVFPKAHSGDLQTYMSTEREESICFGTRLGLCIHIAQAIATLHDCSEHFNVM